MITLAPTKSTSYTYDIYFVLAEYFYMLQIIEYLLFF